MSARFPFSNSIFRMVPDLNPVRLASATSPMRLVRWTSVHILFWSPETLSLKRENSVYEFPCTAAHDGLQRQTRHNNRAPDVPSPPCAKHRCRCHQTHHTRAPAIRSRQRQSRHKRAPDTCGMLSPSKNQPTIKHHQEHDNRAPALCNLLRQSHRKKSCLTAVVRKARFTNQPVALE